VDANPDYRRVRQQQQRQGSKQEPANRGNRFFRCIVVCFPFELTSRAAGQGPHPQELHGRFGGGLRLLFQLKFQVRIGCVASFPVPFHSSLEFLSRAVCARCRRNCLLLLRGRCRRRVCVFVCAFVGRVSGEFSPPSGSTTPSPAEGIAALVRDSLLRAPAPSSRRRRGGRRRRISHWETPSPPPKTQAYNAAYSSSFPMLNGPFFKKLHRKPDPLPPARRSRTGPWALQFPKFGVVSPSFVHCLRLESSTVSQHTGLQRPSPWQPFSDSPCP
jgi:hypothetical protein